MGKVNYPIYIHKVLFPLKLSTIPSQNSKLETTRCLPTNLPLDTIFCLTLHIRWCGVFPKCFWKEFFDVINLGNDPPLKGSWWWPPVCGDGAVSHHWPPLSLSLLLLPATQTPCELEMRTPYILDLAQITHVCTEDLITERKLELVANNRWRIYGCGQLVDNRWRRAGQWGGLRWSNESRECNNYNAALHNASL